MKTNSTRLTRYLDFSYHYTPEQEDFRAEVSLWLDQNVPKDVGVLLDSAESDSEIRRLVRRLGAKGWLAPGDPNELGGAGLSPDLTVIVLEELNQRGLLWLVDGEAGALRSALIGHGTPEQCSTLVRDLAIGGRAVWRHSTSVSSGGGLDTDSVGIAAKSDADGYLVSGEGYFTGVSDCPDILWTVALVEPDEAPVCLLVDAASKGIYFRSHRTLSPAAPRLVGFDDVWVLRSDALGAEGEGHRVLWTRVSLDAGADLPSWVELETDALLEYARSAEHEGEPLGSDPIRVRLLVEAYIASRVARLLRMRGGQGSREGSDAELASLWRRRAAGELSETVGQVVGPAALLSSEDPRAPASGRFERLRRRELAERDAEPSGDPDRETLASELGLG